MPVRLGDFRHGVDAVDYRLQFSLENELEDAVELAQSPHIRSEHRLLLAEEKSQVDLRIVAGGSAASYQTAVGGQALHALRPRSRADVLEDHVHSAFSGDLLHFGRNVLAVVVDYVIS